MMKTRPKQSTRFIKKARELGCDESETRFENTVRKLARLKPKLSPRAKRRQRRKRGR